MAALIEYMDSHETLTYSEGPLYGEITLRFRREDGMFYHFEMIEALKSVLEKRRDAIGEEEAVPL